MDDALLAYYNRELSYIRKMGAEFAEKYPKIAGRLRLDKDIVEDPHVARLIESFAFLTARIRHKLEDDFPELTEALMGTLFPDYHAPLPSLSIVQFRLLPNLTQPAKVDNGDYLRLSTRSGDVCIYQTCMDTSVLPVVVESAKLVNLPTKAPALPVGLQQGRSIQSIIKLRICPAAEGEMFDFSSESLRFYLHGQPSITFKLREFLAYHLVGIAVARDAFDTSPLFLPSSAISSCGFSPEESAIPFDGRTSSAHRLLTEYFLLPEKFLFVELEQIKACWETYPDGFEIYFYLDDTDIELLKGVQESTFKLGCAPIVNLFDSVSQPIQAADVGHEGQLHIHNPLCSYADTYRVNSVTASNSKGQKQTILPFYGAHRDAETKGPYWCVRRENSTWYRGSISHGTDTYLNFVDEEYDLFSPDSDWVITAQMTCTNRDLPSKLPFGPDQPEIYFLEGGAGLRASCLLPPTPTVQPQLESVTRWQLVTQLSLQHFSDADGLKTLKDTLRLYNFNQSKEVMSLIDGIVDLTVDVTTARVSEKGRAALCQGVHFIVTCDETFYTGNSLYLFGCVLDEFLSQYCTINSFTQLTIKTTQRSRSEFEWPPRVGCQPLI